MTAAEWLARARAVTVGATPGPWDYCDAERALGGPSVAVLDDLYVISLTTTPSIDTWEDAAFIAHARTMLPAAVAAIEAVLALAEGWATQPTDYDEDTEQQIDDGHAVRDAIAAVLDGAS